MKITTQQKDIINAVKKYNTIKINAFAGTGKTTTLKLIANNYKNDKILYLAFNSAIKQEASEIFPNNTFVKTTHGLAYSAIARYTDINLSTLKTYRAIDISKKFEISYNQAISALKIFEAFCNSSKLEIKKDDIEHKTAKQLFNNMLLGQIAPTHSFYLKYYHLLLTQEQIPQYKYDIIMLDEAQDTNEVTLAIFEVLEAKTKIYVGDEHQQIYSFRGSSNALNKIKCDKTLYLSCSFRFNNTIASYANRLLQTFKLEKVEITTLDKPKQKPQTYGYISRTNATLISTIASCIKYRRPYVTIRDPKEIFMLTMEVYYLLHNQKQNIKFNRFLKDFHTEDELLEYAKEVEDYELKSAIKVVNQYQNQIFDFYKISDKFYLAWQNRLNNGFDKRLNEILFLTTAHTAKGLEWDNVTIADDFSDFADLILDMQCNTLKQFHQKYNKLTSNELLDEFNLFYVAITRAKQELVKDSENFHYLLAKNISKVINSRIKEAKEDLITVSATTTKVKSTKLQKEEKELLRQQQNMQNNKPKNSGLKWKLEDKIKAQTMYNKNYPIIKIAQTLQRTTSAILAELYKSEIITKAVQNKLTQMIKEEKFYASKIL